MFAGLSCSLYDSVSSCDGFSIDMSSAHDAVLFMLYFRMSDEGTPTGENIPKSEVRNEFINDNDDAKWLITPIKVEQEVDTAAYSRNVINIVPQQVYRSSLL